MGKIYFNPQTGKFWEASFYERKPPEGFVFTGYRKDHRYAPHSYIALAYYCPFCKKYHYYINVFINKLDDIPLHAKMRIEITKAHGCEIADDIITLGKHLGGKRKHYELALRLLEKGILNKFIDKLLTINSSKARKAIEMILSGANDKDIDTLIKS